MTPEHVLSAFRMCANPPISSVRLPSLGVRSSVRIAAGRTLPVRGELRALAVQSVHHKHLDIEFRKSGIGDHGRCLVGLRQNNFGVQ